MSQPQSYTLAIEGMTCASCVGRVDRSLSGLDGVTGVSVNLASETVRLEVSGPDKLPHIAHTLNEIGYAARKASVLLNVESMTCASCVGRVDKALATAPGVLDVNVNLAAETARVTYLEGVTNVAALMRAASDAGYPASVAEATAAQDRSERKEEEARVLARRVIFATILALPVLVMEMGGHVVPALQVAIDASIGRQASWLIQFVLTTIVLFGPGRQFYLKGFPALFKGAPNMNSLVAVGTGAAYAYSLVATFLPYLMPEEVRTVYYEAAAVIVVLVLIGRWLEVRAKGRTGAGWTKA